MPDAIYQYAHNYSYDATIGKGLCVKKGSSVGSVAICSATTDKIIGLTPAPNGGVSGQKWPVVIWGVALAKLGGSVVAGDMLTTDGSGQLIALTRHTHTENTASSYTQNATTAAASVVTKAGRAIEDGSSGEYHNIWVEVGSA